MDLSFLSTYLPDWPVWATTSFAGLSIVSLLILAIQTLYDRSRKNTIEDKSTKDEVAPSSFAIDSSSEQRKRFRRFQREYLAVYLIIMLADWLQGTNMYTLYTSYGVNVSTLFLTGFLSSAVFGTFLGLFVDRFGRRAGCLLFCVLELVINWFEHYPSMPLLLAGRVMGGLSTSLLFSAFETWMVCEHRKRGYPEAWLAGTFSLASVGNGLIAILAGVVAQVAADRLGDIGPFQAAIALTGLALTLIVRWPENYGGEAGTAAAAEGGGQVNLLGQFRDAWACLRGDPRVTYLGLSQAFFEGGMYTFVFMWVPTMLKLVPDGNLPTGLVFSSFMVCITIGGQLFGSALRAVPVGVAAAGVYAAAAAAMAVPALCPAALAPVFAAFLVVEMCVGAFFVCGGTLRSQIFPDALQSSIMSVFRLPLNLLVVVGTKLADAAAPRVVFLTTASWFAAALALQLLLLAARRPPPHVPGGGAAGKQKAL